ncbi:hypothetical protein BEN47_15270 [Hymenobacter lapidarius]|uniref:Uncharacterized protein n=1 Tax=Hymenobacter lapidarius TaxID=1908237 RepID=A0A1G1T2J5_9BACT|nr:hypothetical protein [Hymenobacter lapidarius]OGX85076.1 hypothetical protein BEN47_15270 [Hymenobacter lapidarius]
MPRSTSTRNQKKTINLFLPANLNINSLNVTLTGRPGASALTKGVCYLYHYILKQSCNSHKEVEFQPSFVQVPCQVLRSLLGNSYVQTIELLLRAGYLERLDANEDGEHCPGGYYRSPVYQDPIAKRFRIPVALLGEEKSYVVKQEVVGKAIQNKFAALSAPKGLTLNEPNRAHVGRMMQRIVLVDTPECRQVLAGLAAEGRIKRSPEVYLEMFNQNTFRTVTVDGFGRRLHSEVVNAPRVLRP